jgi:hypothetical protein
MTSRILPLGSALLLIFTSGCQSIRPMANSGLPSITYVTKSGSGTTGYIECRYADAGDATAHKTCWQRGNASTGPWTPTAPGTAVGASAVQVGAYTYPTPRTYYVKFNAQVSGDTAPPVTSVAVYQNYNTVVTIPKYQ